MVERQAVHQHKLHKMGFLCQQSSKQLGGMYDSNKNIILGCYACTKFYYIINEQHFSEYLSDQMECGHNHLASTFCGGILVAPLYGSLQLECRKEWLLKFNSDSANV